MYQAQNPFFSMDQRGHCSYEKHDTIIYNHIALTSSPVHELPPYTKQMEQELFDIYFCYVHPFYPILDRYYILQALKYDSESIPTSLKLAIMAISLHFTQQQQQQDSDIMAATYYQHASIQLDHTPCLASLQTLFLLYKFQELITPVGSSLSTVAVNYLKEIQAMINQLQQPTINNEGVVWSAHDEFVCRASWVVFIIITFSSTADDRWRNMLDCCAHSSKFPSLTETEHYDTGELNIFCNFMHLIKIALLYSQTLSLISDQSSLFINADHPEFIKLAQGLDVWKSSLPNRVTLALTADPPILYSAQNHSIAGIAQDSSKSGSFTSYICLIHDILDLVISIHRTSTSEFVANAQDLDIFKKASQVCYRAHSLTVGDMQAPHFSRLASIQGSRIVSFGLTLALQTQSHIYEKNEEKSLNNAKKYYSCFSLSFQIFDDMLLSPRLYMAIQTLRAQLDAKEQLNLSDRHQQQYDQSPLNSSSNSSAQSTPGINLEDPYQQRREYGFTRSVTNTTSSHDESANAYFYSSANNQHNTNKHSQHQPEQESSHYQTQEQQWQGYNSSYNTTDSWPNNQAQIQNSNYYSSKGDEYSNSIPITPSFEKDFGMSTPPIDAYDPLTPSLVHDTDSYFGLQKHQQVPPRHQLQLQHLQLQQQRYSSFDAAIAIAIASSGSPNFYNSPATIQNSKTCKHQKLI